MIYNNLFYFLVVIFTVSTNSAAAQPSFSVLWTLVLMVAVAWAYAQAASRLFARTGVSSSGYFSAEKRLSILAVAIFVAWVYLLDLKYYLEPLSFAGRLPVLVDIAGLGCFFLLMALMWRAARPRYQQIFQRQYTTMGFIWSNCKVNLPIVLPWLVLSLVFGGLQMLPFPELTEIFRSPWADLIFFVTFVIFLMLAFPPLVKVLWGCRPLPVGPLNDRLNAFSSRLGFSADIYLWPLFEGQVLTAAILGVVPKLRYLLITPALLEALTTDELNSVLAHEIGHVKHRHLLLYMALFLGFSLFAGAVVKHLPYLVLSSEVFYQLLAHIPAAPENVLGVAVAGPLLLLMLFYFRFVFGYFIRHFERQADAYVFQAMGTGWPLISAFEKIALLSGGNKEEKNWHHFGIGERIDFLQRSEHDRGLISRHAHKLHVALVVYGTVLAMAIMGLQQVDSSKLAKGYETRYAEAVLLQKARQEPENSLWLLYLGDFLQSRQLEQRAIHTYEEALKVTPMSAELNNNLAWLLLTAQDHALRNPRQALTLARTAALIKEHGYILDTLATACWANGLLEEAVSVQMKAIRLDPENRVYYQKQLERFRTQRYQEQ
ncbi:MAG: M48 family metalloprotease [Desulfobulbus oligotrophicus]|jgi:Zn-dependent protease with chaperone function|nr:M48 family metalloprotease [Desulfobulbus oligotrophicus]